MINWEDEMNNNFYTIPNDWYNEFNNNFINNNMPNEMNNNLADPKNGFLRGNMFNNLYDPYKNYKYRELKPSNKREEMLYNILMYNFALIELQLYLDVNPMDSNMVNLYNKYKMDEKKICEEYEKEFGPLTMKGLNTGSDRWNWINSPWPWEVVK